MVDALIGYTGFVGSNLAAQSEFVDKYNSKNIESIRGKAYDTLVCSGAPAEKWKANREPEADFRNIQRLMDALSDAQAERFVLVSTIDVYPEPFGVDEDSTIDLTRCHPYGKHRRLLEIFVENHFRTFYIFRLPGLFGPGLKKNIIYDFLHNKNIDQIHAKGIFQFYYTARFWKDITVSIENGIHLLNIATEPTSAQEIHCEIFGLDFENTPHENPACYDFRSKHYSVYGGHSGYLYAKPQILADLKQYVSVVRR
jgi:hypothetical protein